MTDIVITGSRKWTDRDVIRKALQNFDPKTSCVTEGEAQGADAIAREIAGNMGFIVRKMPAKWQEHKDCRCKPGADYCSMAGKRRNTQMLDTKPDVVLAFWHYLSHRGTDDLIYKALKRNIPVKIFKVEK